MRNILCLLKPQFKESVPPETYIVDDQAPDLTGYLEEFGRKVDIQPLANIVQKGMQEFTGEHMRRSKSDAWLAPRVHATLRLSRREAADRRLWSYLAVGPLFQYVHWRWRLNHEASTKFPLRFFGPNREHAIARLWWGAELTRNGASYNYTKIFFGNADVPNSWLNLRAMRHRPTALAAVRFIYEHDIDGLPVGDRHRDLVKSFNAALTTTVLDAVAPYPPTGGLEDWRGEEPDETLYFEDDPVGPNEVNVPLKHIEAVLDLLKRVAQNTNFEARERRGQGKSKAA